MLSGGRRAVSGQLSGLQQQQFNLGLPLANGAKHPQHNDASSSTTSRKCIVGSISSRRFRHFNPTERRWQLKNAFVFAVDSSSLTSRYSCLAIMLTELPLKGVMTKRIFGEERAGRCRVFQSLAIICLQVPMVVAISGCGAPASTQQAQPPLAAPAFAQASPPEVDTEATKIHHQLRITPAQETQWNALSQELKDASRKMQ